MEPMLSIFGVSFRLERMIGMACLKFFAILFRPSSLLFAPAYSNFIQIGHGLDKRFLNSEGLAARHLRPV